MNVLDDSSRREERVFSEWASADAAGRERLRRELQETDPDLARQLEKMEAVERDLAEVAELEKSDLASLRPQPGDLEQMQAALERTAPVRRLRLIQRRSFRIGLSAAAGLLALVWFALTSRGPDDLPDNPALGTDNGVLNAPLDSVESWSEIEFSWSGISAGYSYVKVVVEDPRTGARQISGPVRGERWKPSPDFTQGWGASIRWTIEIYWPGADVPTGPPPTTVRRPPGT